MKITDVKVGDRVKRVDNSLGGSCGYVANDLGKTVTVLKIKDNKLCCVDEYGNYCSSGHDVSGYEPAERTYDNLRVGDVLPHRNYSQDYVKIEGRVGNVYIVTDENGDAYVNSAKELKQTHKLPVSETTLIVKEVSLKEIAEKFNVPVEQLRVKEEK